MLPPGVAAALGAAVLFGFYLYLYKRYFDVLPATVYTAVNEMAGFVWYLLIAAVTWPTGTAVIPATTTVSDLALLGIVGVTVAAATIVSIRALKLGDVSYVAPLNKLVPVFVLPIEFLLLATAIGTVQVAGVALAVVAIYVANYETASVFDPIRRAVTYHPAQLALGGAVLFALGDVGIRAVLSTTPIPPQTTALFSFVAVAGVALPMAVGRVDWPRLRQVLPGLVAISALFAAAVHLATLSFDLAPASIASPLINTQVIIVVLLGSLLLDEKHLRRRLAAAVLAITGIALVATG